MHRDNNTTSFTSDIDTTRDISNHKNDTERKKNFNNAHVTKKANEEFMVYESLSESDIAEDDEKFIIIIMHVMEKEALCFERTT